MFAIFSGQMNILLKYLYIIFYISDNWLTYNVIRYWCDVEKISLILFYKCVTNVSIQYKYSLINGYIHPNMKMKSLSTWPHGNGKSGDSPQNISGASEQNQCCCILLQPVKQVKTSRFKFQATRLLQTNRWHHITRVTICCCSPFSLV